MNNNGEKEGVQEKAREKGAHQKERLPLPKIPVFMQEIPSAVSAILGEIRGVTWNWPAPF